MEVEREEMKGGRKRDGGREGERDAWMEGGVCGVGVNVAVSVYPLYYI